MIMELAGAAVALAAKEAAKTAGKEAAEAGFKLLGWMREKLTGRAKAALDDLEQQPGSQLNQDDLRTQLAKLLEKQPDLVPELRALVSQAQIQGGVMNQTVGAGGKAIQNKGERNTNIIS